MHGHQVEEQPLRDLPQPDMRPYRGNAETGCQQHGGGEQQHDPERDHGDGEGEQREDEQRNARLGQHGGEIGNRQRLPEKNAAIATFGVQGIETVKQRDDTGGRHQQERGEVIRLLEELLLLRGVQGCRGAYLVGQMPGADEESSQEERGDGKGRHINGTVLP